MTHSPLWLSQVRIEVAIHQRFSPLGPPAYGCDNNFYDQGVFRDDVTLYDIPLLQSHLHMESGNVWAMETEHLQGEVLYRLNQLPSVTLPPPPQ